MTLFSKDSGARSGVARRALAIFALIIGLLLSWWTGRGSTTEIHASFLLTHVVAGSVDDGQGRRWLRQLEVLVPVSPTSDQIGWRHALTFPSGGPQASAVVKLTVPRDLETVTVRCRFRLPGTQTEHQSSGSVKIDTARDDVQVVDVGTCR